MWGFCMRFLYEVFMWGFHRERPLFTPTIFLKIIVVKILMYSNSHYIQMKTCSNHWKMKFIMIFNNYYFSFHELEWFFNIIWWFCFMQKVQKIMISREISYQFVTPWFCPTKNGFYRDWPSGSQKAITRVEKTRFFGLFPHFHVVCVGVKVGLSLYMMFVHKVCTWCFYARFLCEVFI